MDGLPEPIPSEKLILADVPDPKSPWDVINRFALTFNGYQFHGSFGACAVLANAHRHDSLDDLRTCLFFEQRRWNHFGDHPQGEDEEYIRSIVRKIREYLTSQEGA